MAKLPLVECRVCHKKDIDRNADPDGESWVMPSNKWYYHRDCYFSWKKSEPLKDEEWIDLIYDFIARDMKFTYNYHMCEAQRKQFIKDGKGTNKGIYFALKYFYEIKHGDWSKGHGGLGIIPYIYNDSCTYWAEQERRSKGIIAEIERQVRAANERQQRVIVQKKIEPRKFKIDLSAIENMEDEE